MKYLVSIATVCLAMSAMATGQWVKQPAPKVNIINEIRGDNSGHFVSLTGIKGVYVSSDAGGTWAAQTVGDLPILPSHIAAFGDTVFSMQVTFTGNVAIWKSAFGSSDWTQVCMTAMPGTRPAGFLATSDGFVVGGNEKFYFSTDHGATWAGTTNGLPSISGFYNLSVSAMIKAGGTIYAGLENGLGGVLRSTDNGASWKRFNFQGAGGVVSALAATSTRLYAGGLLNRIAYADLGDTVWHVLANGPKSVKAIYANEQTIFAGGEGGLFRSTDGGTNWTNLTAGMQTVDGINSIISSGGVLYAGAFTGMYASTDNGDTWVGKNTGFPGENYSVFSMAFSGDTLLLGTGGGVFCTLDDGATWSFAGSGMPTTTVYDLYYYKGAVFAAQGGIFKSDDAGKSWKRTEGIPGYVSAFAFTGDDASLFAMTQNGLFRSTDLGLNWADANGDKSFSTTTAQSIGGYLYHSCQYGLNPGTWVSSDQGAHWTGVSAGLPAASDDPVKKFYSVSGGVLAVTSKKLVYKTTNHGTNWSEVSTNIPNETVISGFQFGTTLAFQTYTGPYFSTDGASWAQRAEGLNEWPWNVAPVAVHNGKLYGLTEMFMFTRPVSDVATGVRRLQGVPSAMRLEQNYPNPFNPATTIRYDVSEASQVRLTVIDLLGREVALLVNERQQAGSYAIPFDAASMANGVYYYRLDAGSFHSARRMVLLK